MHIKNPPKIPELPVQGYISQKKTNNFGRLKLCSHIKIYQKSTLKNI